MKKIFLILCLLQMARAANAQLNDTSLGIADTAKGVDSIHLSLPDTAVIVNENLHAPDTAAPAMHNKYGDLLNDDPGYNPKYSWLVPAVRVIGQNAFTWAMDRYVFKYDWSRISPKTWKANIKQGWEWDADRFGVNFIGHPYSGSGYFNTARANGYSFWQSFPYAVEGSLMWEYFGENSRPSYNDIINTPVSGMFLGEVLYRLSSNILDDRTTGAQRVFRELFAGILDPTRALNRLTQGKMFRVTSKEVYQKEPLNVTLYAGIHKVNDKIGDNNKFGTGSTNAVFHIQLDYGDPFETRYRKPFDLFRVRMELGYGTDRYLIDNINGYGILAGKNLKENRLLGGIFQYFDYWHNNIFEVGALGFGGGLISKIPVAQHSNIYSSLHLAAVPLAGNNTQYGPDTSEFRHYNFGGGLEGRSKKLSI